MCLIAWQRKRLVVPFDLPVLKLVFQTFNPSDVLIPDLFTTPYKNEIISVPSKVTAKGRYNPTKTDFLGTERFEVREGMIHLYRDDLDALMHIRASFDLPENGTLAILRGVIPAFAPFSPGEFGEVCAKTVRYMSVEAYNTEDDRERLLHWWEEQLIDYRLRAALDPWEAIINKILLETDNTEKKEN